ncbi:hypothetical protein EYF80_021870 [Liparis tanakae]|uniref:Uncharacterized protein n=1 Tax=Liparis tanakae TaxID=230148 RepID=A0A4Z2HQP7_9TELE|nr:hypothetical protein EYF80_021870 [Liparis tanakae]
MALSWTKLGLSTGLQAQHFLMTAYSSLGQSGGFSSRSPSLSTRHRIWIEDESRRTTRSPASPPGPARCPGSGRAERGCPPPDPEPGLPRSTAPPRPDLDRRLPVGLLDVAEVLGAGDVEAISDAQVELLQLDLGQEMIQPLSVFVHQHHLADLP